MHILVHLLVILLLLVTLTALGGLGLLSADTAGAATTEGRGESEVNVLLGVETDDERGDVDDLLADSDVALADQDTGVVDGLGQTKLPDAGLEAALQEILDLEGQDVIQLHAGLVKNTDADETANEGIAFEETLGVLLVEGKKLTVSVLESVFSMHKSIRAYRAARRILDRVKPTRQTSRLLRRPYSPTSFNSESLLLFASVYFHNRLKQRQAHVQWPVILTVEQTRRVCEGHGRSSNGRGEAS